MSQVSGYHPKPHWQGRRGVGGVVCFNVLKFLLPVKKTADTRKQISLFFFFSNHESLLRELLVSGWGAELVQDNSYVLIGAPCSVSSFLSGTFFPDSKPICFLSPFNLIIFGAAPPPSPTRFTFDFASNTILVLWYFLSHVHWQNFHNLRTDSNMPWTCAQFIQLIN